MVKPATGRALLLGGRITAYHDFSVMGPLIASLLEEAGYEVTRTEDRDALLAPNIRPYDIVASCTTGGHLTPAQEQGLLDAVIGHPSGETGKPKGFIGLHGAAASFEGNPRYLAMLGGRFLTHPDIGPSYDFTLSHPDHPVTSGLADFSMVDELYLMETTGSRIDLLTSEYSGFTVPVAWVKPYGRGRVFYCSLGHGPEQVSHPSFRRLVTNAACWVRFEPARSTS